MSFLFNYFKKEKNVILFYGSKGWIGGLFIDYIKPLRRKMLQGKLNDINKGKVRVDYKMIQLK